MMDHSPFDISLSMYFILLVHLVWLPLALCSQRDPAYKKIQVRLHWLKLFYHIGIGHPLRNPYAGNNKCCSAFGGLSAAIFLDEDDKISAGKAKGSTESPHSRAGEGTGAAESSQILPPSIQLGYF